MEKKIKTFEEFSNAVMELAGDRYFAVAMEKTTYQGLGESPREVRYEYKCYMERYSWHVKETPEDAIYELKKQMRLIDGGQEGLEAEIK